MTTKRSKRAAAATPAKKATPAAELSIPMRNRAPVEAPKKPRMETITPAVGPNADGLAHQTLLAHATDDEERTRLATELEARTPNATEG